MSIVIIATAHALTHCVTDQYSFLWAWPPYRQGQTRPPSHQAQLWVDGRKWAHSRPGFQGSQVLARDLLMARRGSAHQRRLTTVYYPNWCRWWLWHIKHPLCSQAFHKARRKRDSSLICPWLARFLSRNWEGLILPKWCRLPCRCPVIARVWVFFIYDQGWFRSQTPCSGLQQADA